MKKNVIGLFAIVLLLGVFIISCDEDLLNLPQVEEEDKTTVEDNSAAELKVARVFENINNFGISEEGKKNADLAGCPEVTWSGFTMTLDFTGCTNGTSGKIIAAFDQAPSYGVNGLTANVTFDNYVGEGTSISGSIELKITGLAGGAVGPTFSVKVLQNLTFAEGNDTHVWEAGSERIFKWLEGFATLNDNTDDVYSLEGNSSGVNTDGVPYEVNITTPLIFDMSCEYIPEGVMEIVNNAGTEDEKTLTIDFAPGAGDETGQCDSWVSISTGSFTVKFDINQ